MTDLTKKSKNSAKTVKPESATARFFKEMKSLRKEMPKNWRTVFFKRYPDYDNHKGTMHVENVYYLRSTDALVMDAFKEIIAEAKKGVQTCL